MCRSGRCPDIELCKERGFAVSLGEWRREIFGVAAPLYRTPTGDCLSVNCGIPSFRFSAEQIERECGPRILGLARSIRSLVANDRQSPTMNAMEQERSVGLERCGSDGEETMSGRASLGLAAGVAATLLGRACASAAGRYPNRPIHVVVPYPRGGIVDYRRASGDRAGRPRLRSSRWSWSRSRGANSNYRHRRRSRGASPTGTPGWSRGPRCWSIRPCTRTPAGTRCRTSNASVSRSGTQSVAFVNPGHDAGQDARRIRAVLAHSHPGASSISATPAPAADRLRLVATAS